MVWACGLDDRGKNAFCKAVGKWDWPECLAYMVGAIIGRL